MFIQVMKGKCTRQDELRAVSDAWDDEVRAVSVGFLGGTFGFTDDDTFIGVARFSSREDAETNSNLPEQTAWAERFQATFDGPVEFFDSDDVGTILDGGSDDAGFVQVIHGRTGDVDKFREFMSDDADLREMRPDIIGGTFAIGSDGTFYQTVAFTDEASAREGEQTPPPPEVQEAFTELMPDPTFYDLRNPWFVSA